MWDALSQLFLIPLLLIPLSGLFSPSPTPGDPNGLLSSPGPGDTSHPVLHTLCSWLLTGREQAALPQLASSSVHRLRADPMDFHFLTLPFGLFLTSFLVLKKK